MISQVQLLESMILSLFRDQYSDIFLVFIYLVTKLVLIKLVTKLILMKLVTKLVTIKLIINLISMKFVTKLVLMKLVSRINYQNFSHFLLLDSKLVSN